MLRVTESGTPEAEPASAEPISANLASANLASAKLVSSKQISWLVFLSETKRRPIEFKNAAFAHAF